MKNPIKSGTSTYESTYVDRSRLPDISFLKYLLLNHTNFRHTNHHYVVRVKVQLRRNLVSKR